MLANRFKREKARQIVMCGIMPPLILPSALTAALGLVVMWRIPEQLVIAGSACAKLGRCQHEFSAPPTRCTPKPKPSFEDAFL